MSVQLPRARYVRSASNDRLRSWEARQVEAHVHWPFTRHNAILGNDLGEAGIQLQDIVGRWPCTRSLHQQSTGPSYNTCTADILWCGRFASRVKKWYFHLSLLTLVALNFVAGLMNPMACKFIWGIGEGKRSLHFEERYPTKYRTHTYRYNLKILVWRYRLSKYNRWTDISGLLPVTLPRAECSLIGAGVKSWETITELSEKILDFHRNTSFRKKLKILLTTGDFLQD